MSEDTHITTISVEEAFIADWAAEGIDALEAYLARHAAFAEYLRARGVLESDDGHSSRAD